MKRVFFDPFFERMPEICGNFRFELKTRGSIHNTNLYDISYPICDDCNLYPFSLTIQLEYKENVFLLVKMDLFTGIVPVFQNIPLLKKNLFPFTVLCFLTFIKF